MSEKTTVLIVEDDEILRDAMCDTVKYGGYQAIPAAHGGEALEVLDERRVDLVISDVEMDDGWPRPVRQSESPPSRASVRAGHRPRLYRTGGKCYA